MSDKKEQMFEAIRDILNEESPITGKRLISKHEGKDGHHAEVRHNKEWGEYEVHHFHNGKHMGEGPVSYHDDKQDAKETAEYETKHFKPKNGSLVREETQIDEADAKAYQKVVDLKQNGKHEEAGRHAARIGHPRSYGPHFGMRKDLDDSKFNFFKGYDAEKSKMKNEEVQIDEVSNETLKSYKARAKKSHEMADKTGDIYMKMTHQENDPAKRQKYFGKMKKNVKTMDKRERGMKMANKKLGVTSEETQIDELSKKTLGNYIHKATSDLMQRTTNSDRLKRDAETDFVNAKPMSQVNAKREKAQKEVNKKFNRHYGIQDAARKLAKEETDMNKDEDIFVVESDDFGDGTILSVHEDHMEVMFAHGIEKVSFEDLDEYSNSLVEEYEQLDEISKDALVDYKNAASNDPAFEKTKGRVPAAKAKTRAKRTSGLEMAKAKLQKIYKKESEAHEAKMNKHAGELNSKFQKEAPAVLKKHGYTKVSDGDTHHTWVKPHDDGHTTSVTIGKSAGKYGSSAEYNITNSKHTYHSRGQVHGSLWRDKHVSDAHKNMVPEFEGQLINHHKRHESGW